MRAVWLSVLALLVAAIVIVAMVASILGSSAGTRWLIERGIAAAGVPIEVSRIDGSALRGVHIDALRIRLEHATIDIKALEVEPAWGASGVRRALVLDRLAAASISVTTTAEPNQRAPLEWVVPVPPISFDVRSLRIDRFATDRLPERYAPAVAARVAYDGAAFSLHDLDLRATALQITGDLTLVPGKDVPIGGDLTWRLFDPALSGHVALTRTLRELDFEARVDEPLRADARGRIRLLGEVDPYFTFSTRVSEWTMSEWANARVKVSRPQCRRCGDPSTF